MSIAARDFPSFRAPRPARIMARPHLDEILPARSDDKRSLAAC
jgi:hypothetical protein